MDKNKIFTLITVLVIFGLIASIVRGSINKREDGEILSENSKDAYILYYGITCPHCKELDEWIEENNIKEKVEIVEKEIYENAANRNEMAIKAKSCGLNTSELGVPFMYADGKCYMGLPPIQEFLSEVSGVEVSSEINDTTEKTASESAEQSE